MINVEGRLLLEMLCEQVDDIHDEFFRRPVFEENFRSFPKKRSLSSPPPPKATGPHLPHSSVPHELNSTTSSSLERTNRPK